MNDLVHRFRHDSQPEHLGSSPNNLSILNALGFARCFDTFFPSVVQEAQDRTVLDDAHPRLRYLEKTRLSERHVGTAAIEGRVCFKVRDFWKRQL